uniref:Uncharacterized protein n=1 Tax=Rhizophagus irregularis (strain DAOM 181602 / DAOM 197198 / MUCL 43194) TaxID=747089 RepID=U9U448_RHIID
MIISFRGPVPTSTFRDDAALVGAALVGVLSGVLVVAALVGAILVDVVDTALFNFAAASSLLLVLLLLLVRISLTKY